MYFLCTLLDAPDDADVIIKNVGDEILQLGLFCSPWTSVMSLEAIGAFRYQEVDLPFLELGD